MNNANIFNENIETKEDNSAIFREQIELLTQVIEALQNIANSSYWKVLQQHVFNVDLNKAKKRLVVEKDTTEIFRLQGEIGFREKLSLEKLLQTKRNELEAIRKKL